MLGDTAVAVHPEDPRYKHLIGRQVTLPLTGRAIPIIGDAILVDPKFGTGCVKVTPAHDPNDYATGLRHKLPMINLLNPDGTYNENAGPYAGLDRIVVRKRVVADLEAQGLLAKVEPHANRVGLSDRSKTPIEPYLSDQWFVRMDTLAQDAMDAVTTGAVKIHPERYAKTYLDWLGEKRDWCISRQLWWGHRIPVWSITLPKSVGAGGPTRSAEHEGLTNSLSQQNHALRTLRLIEEFQQLRSARSESDLKELYGDAIEIQTLPVENGSQTLVLACVDAGREDIERELEAIGFDLDPDVLDTWFSSALWPHSTLGWPEATPELAKYYPTSVLSTARDIISLWVARMVIFGRFNVGEVPFRDVFIHPVIQDGNGKRMSKSAGNGIDPVDIIDLYGADALRFTLALATTETQDLRMPVEKAKLPDGRAVNTSERFEQGRTFPNKLWNAARFALMNLEGYEAAPVAVADLPIEDRWILSGLAQVAEETTADLEVFRFAEATKRLRDFTWNSFCDWYVEFLKGRLRDPETRPTAQRVLAAVLDGLCRLLHPVMPFVTEQIWQALGQVAPLRGLPEPVPAEESVCIAAWPSYPAAWQDAEAEATVAQWQEKITAIRNLRAEKEVPKAAKIAPILVAEEPVATLLRRGEAAIKALTDSSSLTIVRAADRPADAAVTVLADAEIILPLEGLIDRGAELARARKAVADLDKQLVGVRAKLANEQFVANAKPEVVEVQRAKLAELENQRLQLQKVLGEG